MSCYIWGLVLKGFRCISSLHPASLSTVSLLFCHPSFVLSSAKACYDTYQEPSEICPDKTLKSSKGTVSEPALVYPELPINGFVYAKIQKKGRIRALLTGFYHYLIEFPRLLGLRKCPLAGFV